MSGITLLQGDSDEDTHLESISDEDPDADMHVDLMDVDEELTENEKAARHRHEIGGARDMFSGRARHQQTRTRRFATVSSNGVSDCAEGSDSNSDAESHH